MLEHAQQAASMAYAPYSQFSVGAAVLTRNGEVYTGANIENASYGLTVCAERTALFKAVIAGQRDVVAVAVWTPNRPGGLVTPCGACRQVMSEFMAADAEVILAEPEPNSEKTVRRYTLAELLPESFVLERSENA